VTLSWQSWDEVVKNRSKGYEKDTDILLNAAAETAHQMDLVYNQRTSGRKRLVLFDSE
jgi:hypothetical protein